MRQANALLLFLAACGDRGPTVNCELIDVASFVTVTVIDHTTKLPNASGWTGTLTIGSQTLQLQPISFRAGGGTLGVMNAPAGEFDLALSRNGIPAFRQTGTLVAGVCGGVSLDLAAWY